MCFCLSFRPAGGKPVGLLLLHLPRVPGPEGGVSRNVGGDHQWPDTKGGVGPHSHDLLPQEVTSLAARTRAALRWRKRPRGEEKSSQSRRGKRARKKKRSERSSCDGLAGDLLLWGGRSLGAKSWEWLWPQPSPRAGRSREPSTTHRDRLVTKCPEVSRPLFAPPHVLPHPGPKDDNSVFSTEIKPYIS